MGLAPLRNQRFFSLAEANAAIRERVDALNNKTLTGMQESRKDLYEEIDRPALLPLPDRRFEIADRKLDATVHIDYHVSYDEHLYSVPFRLVGKKVDIRATTTTVEPFYKGKRVASHIRSYGRRRPSTAPEHRPKSHAAYADWSPERMRRWAAALGPSVETLAVAIMQAKRAAPGSILASAEGAAARVCDVGVRRVSDAVLEGDAAWRVSAATETASIAGF